LKKDDGIIVDPKVEDDIKIENDIIPGAALDSQIDIEITEKESAEFDEEPVKQKPRTLFTV
jgi:hypothetical protein